MRSKLIFIFLAMILLASCAAPIATQTSEVSETSDVLTEIPTSTPAPVMRIVVTPGAPIAELPSSAEIDSSNAALPQWIIGNFEAMGLPDGLEPTTWDSAKYTSVRQHGLVPVLEDGTIASHKRGNGLVYAPTLAQISSEDGTVLSASGEIQPGGIMEYVSADGAVKRNLRAGVACPNPESCLLAVSYNSEDAGGTYWVQVDPDTGEITAYSPAVTEDKPGRAAWLPVGDKWSSALMGSTALQAGEAYGIDYQRSVDGATNIFFFAAGDKEYQAKDREIHYTPTDKRLWVENESGIFLFDNTTHEWTRVADMGTQMIGVGDEQMIIADEAWHTVESIDGSSGVQIVTTQDGQKWVWDGAGWEVAVTQENTLTYKNYDGQEVTVELPLYHYTNKAGETLEIVHPPDQMACLKYLADKSRWYPAIADQQPLNRSMATDGVFRELWAELDYIPSSGRPYWVSAYPISGGPFMVIFVAGWQGGTLLGGKGEDGAYFTLFCGVTPDEFKNHSEHIPEAEEYLYLRELATQHQE